MNDWRTMTLTSYEGLDGASLLSHTCMHGVEFGSVFLDAWVGYRPALFDRERCIGRSIVWYGELVFDDSCFRATR